MYVPVSQYSTFRLLFLLFTVEKSLVRCEHTKNTIITKKTGITQIRCCTSNLIHLPFDSILFIVNKPQYAIRYTLATHWIADTFFSVKMLNAVYNQLCPLCLQTRSTVCCMRFVVIHMHMPKSRLTGQIPNEPQTSNVRHIFANELMRWHWCIPWNAFAYVPNVRNVCKSQTERKKLSKFPHLCSMHSIICMMWSLTQRTHHTNLKVKSNQILSSHSTF